MSPTKFKPLLAATVMSAIYMAGVPNTSQASMVQTQLTDNQVSLHKAAIKGGVDYTIPEAVKGMRRYIVQFEKQPVALKYDLASKVGRNAADTQGYINLLKNDQAAFIQNLSSVLSSSQVLQQYQLSFNGIALKMPENEASLLESMPGVKSVALEREYFVNTDVGPHLIGANNLWEGHGAANPDVIFMDGFDGPLPHGSGVVVGVIDTGINFGHPSFEGTTGDGYTHVNPLGDGNYLGVCAGTTGLCNEKLVGVYDFVAPLGNPGLGGQDGADENGHGSHTASTAAGNKVDNVPFYGQNLTISGVAPKANILAYRACYTNTSGQGTCPQSATLASVEQAIEDGIVDVINYSIGGGTSPWNDPVSMAFLSATQAGILVSASAGNSGPASATLGHVEPWTASVAATTHSRILENITMDIGSDPTTQNIDYTPAVDGPALSSTITAEMRFSGDVDPANDMGCDPWPNGNEFTGEIALIDIYDCPFAQKTGHAYDAGAVAVVIISNSETPYLMGGFDGQQIPSMSIALSHGQSAIAEMAGGTVTTTINAPVLTYNGQADVVADFSSRGPSPYEYNKPDVAAPGVSILAAVSDSGSGTPDFGAISGTSMAAPHNAGAAALLMERHRDWSVAEVKSALMMKAVTAGVTKEDGTTQADPFDIGAGRIQVDAADKATFVLDESATRFIAENPAIGGDLKRLNVASLTDYNCEGTCSFTRIIRSVADEPIDYVASLINGVSGTVTPSAFTLPKNGYQVLNIEVDTTGLTPEEFSFGQLEIKTVEYSSTTFTESVGAVIVSGGYPGDQACGQVAVSGVTYPLPAGTKVTVDYDLNYTWIGDLVATAENPNGDLLGVLDRPGYPSSMFGSSGDFLTGATVRFDDDAGTSAEDATGCTSGTCVFAPAPDTTISAPPSTIAELTATDVNGTWEMCVGSADVFVDGILNTVSVNVSAPLPSTNASYMPVTIYTLPTSPVVTTNPGELNFTLATNSSDSQTFDVGNDSSATAALDWNVQSTGMANVKQFEQVNTGTGNGILSDYVQANSFGHYSADNFTLNSSAQLDVFYFDGFTNGADLSADIDAFTVEVYADNAGEPAGDPETAASALYVLTLPVGDPNLILTPGGEVTVNVKAAVGSSWTLGAGNYWVSGWADLSGADTWNWFAGVPAAGDTDVAMGIDPSDYFGDGTNWLALTDVDPVFAGLAFSVSSEYDCTTPSWLSVTPSSGTGVAIGGSDTVTVTVDSTGLAAGNYSAAVCIASNDIANPFVAVPVSVTVN